MATLVLLAAFQSNFQERGLKALEEQHYQDAIDELNNAIAAEPKDYALHFNLALAYSLLGKDAEGITQYRKALELDPKSAAAESGLGRALAKEDKLSDAAPHFRRAAELDPSYRDSLLELAALYEATKQPEEAIALYREFPDNPAAQERVGALQLQTGKLSDAVNNLEAAVAKSPIAANRAALATAYLKNHQPDKAFPLITQLVQAQPNDYELRMVYGRMLRDQRKFPEASQEFFRATQLRPDSAESWSEFAGVLIMAESYPPALGALDRLAALHAEKPGHVYLRAIVLDKIKQYKPALESYQRFLEISQGQSPDEEFKARQRVRIIQKELSKR